MCTCPLSPEERIRYQQIVATSARLLTEGKFLSYQRGQTIFYAGHLPYGLYVVQEGVVSIPTDAGQLLGLRHLLARTPYCETAIAKSDVEVMFFSRTYIDQQLQRGPL